VSVIVRRKPWSQVAATRGLRVPSTKINWEGALCEGMYDTNPELDPFFVDKEKGPSKKTEVGIDGGKRVRISTKTKLTRGSKELCNRGNNGKPCAVRDECLRYAVVNNITDGVWGGTTSKEREKLKKQSKKREKKKGEAA